MKKGEKKQETVKEQPISNVRAYFTKEINSQMVEMTSKEMETLMKELISKREWIAMLKYVSIRTMLLDSQLRTCNPSNDPHTISWSQGALAGLSDIENYVIELNSSKKEEEDIEENTNYDPEGKIQ
ncbi:MAG: hypothetical protein WC917_04060 [Bacilli bacterium]|jgi:hypothetical protein